MATGKPTVSVKIVYGVEGAKVPFCAVTYTVPPDKFAVPPTSSLLACAALALTIKVEPAEANVAAHRQGAFGCPSTTRLHELVGEMIAGDGTFA